MSHDPCTWCGDRTGSTSDNMEILVDGDAPPATLCSYECLIEWARDRCDLAHVTCPSCSSSFTPDEADHDGYGMVCPGCGYLL